MIAEQATDNRLRDDFPDTSARRAVVAVVRGFGALQRMMSPYYAQFGLTPPQFQTLTVLNQLSNERVTQRGLARELYVSFPNTTVMLARLEKNGYIERTANPTDRRENFVRISRSGRALLRKTWKFQPTQLERAMAGLEDEERNELSRLLNKMISGQDGRPIDIESFAADGSS